MIKRKITLTSVLYNILMYFMAVVWIIPLIWLLRTAFMPAGSATDISAPLKLTLENFTEVLDCVPFFNYYINTILIVIGTLAVQLILITLASYAFARMEFRGKKFLFILFLIQLMITPDVLIFPMYQLMTKLNLVNNLVGIMVPFFASAMGIFLMRQNMKTIPMELEEAARLEGCSTMKLIFGIYAPLLKPTYAAFSIISVSYHWNDFLWPLVMINDVSKRPVTLGLAIFAQAYETGAQWNQICAATVIVIAPLLIVFLFLQRQFIESFAKSGVK